MYQGSSRLRSYESVPFLFRIMDIVVLCVVFVIAIALYSIDLNKDYLLLLLSTLIAFTFFTEALELYRKLELGKFTQRIVLLFAVISFSFLAIILVLFFIKEAETFSRGVILIWYVFSVLALISWRFVYRMIKRKEYQNPRNMRNIAIIGMTASGLKLAEEIDLYDELGLKCIGFFDDRDKERLTGDSLKLLGNIQDVIALAQEGKVDSLYICLPLKAEERIEKIILSLGNTTTNVFMIPDLLLNTLIHGNVTSLGSLTAISVFDTPLNISTNQFIKRVEDIVLSSCILLLISPVMIVVAVGVKVTSSGPIFYKQVRVGWNGRHFNMLKFRSMPMNSEKDGVRWGGAKNKTNTKFGRFIRATSLDELPQFLNVLKGEMSIIGPRPERDVFVEKFRHEIPFYMQKHTVKAGISGWAQVNGLRGDTSLEKRVEYDLHYINNWSLWLDIKIIIMTIFKGFTSKNAC
ncbi:MAG: undecaprenyl-phosphate glucose phosphotransferase [Thiomicrorhabdus sp.]|nr:undecaprenyl-phosphate glucose phosphotransferase [Thiomicrorhabdus sp.]